MNSSDAAVASATAIDIGETSADARAIPQANTDSKAIPRASTDPKAIPPKTRFAAIFNKTKSRGGCKRCISLLDFFLRLLALGAALSAAVAMGTADQTLPFFTNFFQFHANFSNFPSLTFFVIGNAIAAGYLLLSLPFSVIGMIRPQSTCPRLLLLVLDVVMVALTTASASSAASIVYLAHEGNSGANWVAICNRFGEFCQQMSGAVVGSFVGVVILMLLVVMAAVALAMH